MLTFFFLFLYESFLIMDLIHIVTITDLLNGHLPVAALFRLRRVCTSFRKYVDSSEECKKILLSQMQLKIRSTLPGWDSIFFSVTTRCRECCLTTRAKYLHFRVCKACTSDKKGYRSLVTCKEVARYQNMSHSWARRQLIQGSSKIKKGQKGEIYYRRVDMSQWKMTPRLNILK